MAKRKSVTVYRPSGASPTIRIHAPAPISRARRAGRLVRRGAGRAASAAYGEKHTLLALAAAFGFGYLERSGQQLPSIGGFTPLETAALAAWAIGKFGKNRIAAHMGTGLGSVAMYKWGRGETAQGVSGVGYVY